MIFIVYARWNCVDCSTSVCKGKTDGLGNCQLFHTSLIIFKLHLVELKNSFWRNPNNIFESTNSNVGWTCKRFGISYTAYCIIIIMHTHVQIMVIHWNCLQVQVNIHTRSRICVHKKILPKVATFFFNVSARVTLLLHSLQPNNTNEHTHTPKKIKCQRLIRNMEQKCRMEFQNNEEDWTINNSAV